MCLHTSVRPLGAVANMPPAWLAAANVTPEPSDQVCAWCRQCLRYVSRDHDSTNWTPLSFATRSAAPRDPTAESTA